MKIIKQGRVPEEERPKRFRCLQCDCIWEAEKGEYSPKFDRNELNYLSRCPFCGRQSSTVVVMREGPGQE